MAFSLDDLMFFAEPHTEQETAGAELELLKRLADGESVDTDIIVEAWGEMAAKNPADERWVWDGDLFTYGKPERERYGRSLAFSSLLYFLRLEQDVTLASNVYLSAEWEERWRLGRALRAMLADRMVYFYSVTERKRLREVQ